MYPNTAIKNMFSSTARSAAAQGAWGLPRLTDTNQSTNASRTHMHSTETLLLHGRKLPVQKKSPQVIDTAGAARYNLYQIHLVSHQIARLEGGISADVNGGWSKHANSGIADAVRSPTAKGAASSGQSGAAHYRESIRSTFSASCSRHCSWVSNGPAN